MSILNRVATALLLVCAAGWSAGVLEGSAQSDRPPNVLLIISDDLNNDLGTYSHPLVLSPNIDRLAQRGVRFDRAYNQYPQCAQSRASFLTGLRPDSIKVYDLNTHIRETVPDVVTLPQHFRNNGYFVARIGKLFHQDVPGEVGSSGRMDDEISWDAVVNPIGIDREDLDSVIFPSTPHRQNIAHLSYRADAGPDEVQTDGIIATEAVQMLEIFRQNPDQPFFLGVGFYRPHFPYIAPQRYWDLYPADEMETPGDPTADLADVPDAAVTFTQPPNWGMSPEQMRVAISGYYASITFMDAQVGRVLEAMDRLGLWENTIVVLMSDHGYHQGEKGQWLKQSLYEPSARSPLIVAAPGVAANSATARVVEYLDLYPTLVDLAGLPMPTDLQGRSLRPLLSDPRLPWPHAAYTQVRRGGGQAGYMGYTVRTERWRYTEWDNGERGVELYDHRHDPGEVLNLASDPAYATTVTELRALLHKEVNTRSTVLASLETDQQHAQEMERLLEAVTERSGEVTAPPRAATSEGVGWVR